MTSKIKNQKIKNQKSKKLKIIKIKIIKNQKLSKIQNPNQKSQWHKKWSWICEKNPAPRQGAKIHHPLEMVKNPPPSNLFSPNHTRLSFESTRLDSSYFVECFQNVKIIFFIWKTKRGRHQHIFSTFWNFFSNSKDLFFDIHKRFKNQRVSIKISVDVVREQKGCWLADFLPFFSGANFCTSPRSKST